MADLDQPPSPLSLAIAMLSSSDHHVQTRRGPNYAAYSRLRESRLRKRRQLQEQSYLTTPKKKKEAGSPMVARSVPDFASALKKEKENRKPPSVPRLDMSMGSASPLPPKGPTRRCAEAASLLKTPSPVGASRRPVVGGSVRKSYSSLKETKGLGDVDGSSGGRYGNVMGSGARRYG